MSNVLEYVFVHTDKNHAHFYRSWNEKDGHHWQPFASNAQRYTLKEVTELISHYLPELQFDEAFTIHHVRNAG
jgi:hypothetical protein